MSISLSLLPSTTPCPLHNIFATEFYFIFHCYTAAKRTNYSLAHPSVSLTLDAAFYASGLMIKFFFCYSIFRGSDRKSVV